MSSFESHGGYCEARAWVVKEQARLDAERDEFLGKGLSIEIVQIAQGADRARLFEVWADVHTYQDSLLAEFEESSHLGDLGRLLVALRMAKGLTVADLAERLKASEEDVLWDEQIEYGGVKIERVQEILRVFNAYLITQVEMVERCDTEVIHIIGPQRDPTGPESDSAEVSFAEPDSLRPILTHKEYRQVRAWVVLEQRLLDVEVEELQGYGLSELEILDHLEARSLKLNEVQCAVEKYENGVLRNFTSVLNLEGLGEILVGARILKGITEQELAKRLDDPTALQVMWNEQSNYRRASIERVKRVASALGLRLRTTVERLGR